MSNFYFTFTMDQGGGWAVVKANNIHDAIRMFQIAHPHPNGDDYVNCAFYYTEEDFKNTTMYKNRKANFDRGEVEVISLNVKRS